MPIHSMTGFGSATRAWRGPDGPRGVVVEIRAVNGRHLDVRVRQPFAPQLEHELRTKVERRLGRGRVDVSIGLRAVGDESAPIAGDPLATLGIDPLRLEAVLRASVEVAARAARAKLEVLPPTSLQLLEFAARQQRTVATDPEAGEPPPFLSELVEAALDQLVAFRSREGEALAGVLAGLAGELGQMRARIAAAAADEPARAAALLRERVRSLLDPAELAAIDPARLAQEVALLVARSDVAEELARAEIHLARFAEVLAQPPTSGQGRTLEFVAQELLREFTTIGSKIASHAAAAVVIDAKGTIERIREQVQNVE